MSRLFQPMHLGPLELSNRILIAPMCQYSADAEGNATDWHMIHLGQMAVSGAGLLIIEATAVSPEARITPSDLGLYSDANEAALERVMKALRLYSQMPIAIQIAHAGRKASSYAPWDSGAQIKADQPQAWHSEAPSAVPHAEGEDAPMALDRAGLERVRNNFVATAVALGAAWFSGHRTACRAWLFAARVSVAHRQQAHG